MKNMRIPSVFFLMCCMALTSGSVNAQSVSMSPIPRTSFCEGDSISVGFTVTGFFGHRNAFTLQLSDPSGGFSNFQNLGSLIDTLPGTFTINTTIPASVTSSTQYRFRILAAIPYTISADNGSDIAIGTGPYLGFERTSGQTASTGTPITVTADADSISLHDDAFWDFGPGANPAKATTTAIVDSYHNVTFSHDVEYSTPGDKTVTLTVVAPGGCSTMHTYELHIFDCSIPSIPHDVIVINSDTTLDQGHSRAFWVNPGVLLYLNGGLDTIFAEPGSTISHADHCILYMKPGSVFKSEYSGGNTVIFGDGASINTSSNDFTLNCPTLDFNYTNAPPNAAHPLAGVVNTSLPSLQIRQEVAFPFKAHLRTI